MKDVTWSLLRRDVQATGPTRMSGLLRHTIELGARTLQRCGDLYCVTHLQTSAHWRRVLLLRGLGKLALWKLAIIIIIIIIISFTQDIYTYIPETNYFPMEYSVAAILLFLCMVHISLAPVLNLLHFYISAFRSMCAVPNMTVFCSSLTSLFPGMLLMYFLNDFK
jgi:hypothetical protein